MGGNLYCEVVCCVKVLIEYCKKEGDYFEIGEVFGGVGSCSDFDVFKDDVK